MKASRNASNGLECAPHRMVTGTCLGFLLLALAIWQTGCASAKSPRTASLDASTTKPPSLAAVGIIGVIATSTVPNFTIQQPLNRQEAGEFTARQIVFLGGDDFTDDASAFLSCMTLGISPFVLSALAVPSRTVAEAMAIPEKNLSKANASMSETISKLNLQEELRTRVVQQAVERTSLPIKLVQKPLPLGREKEFSRMSCVMAATLAWLPPGQTAADYLAGQGFDTVLELHLVNPGLKGPGKINPPLALCSDVRASLFEVGSGRELWRGTARYRSAKHKFTEWAADEAQLFRGELDHCVGSLAEQIVVQLFGQSSNRSGYLVTESAQLSP